MDAVLELKSVSKEYAGHRAVDDVTLALERGEFFSLVGPSGCGKTTTLRMIAGFEEPTSGEILLRRKPVNQLPPCRRDVSTVFQSYALFPHLTVEANIAFGLERGSGNNRVTIKQRVSEMLELLQLRGKEKRKPAQLSGGEKQRVALARSLIVEPAVLLLDEPLSALDPQLRKHLRSELKGLQKRLRTTFLFITHDQEEALALSDRIGVMNGGRLEQAGTPLDLYRYPETRFVAEFLGDVNWIRSGSGVRPADVRLELHRATDSEAERCRPAVITSLEFLGSRWQVTAELEDGSAWKCEVNGGECGLELGQTVYAKWQRRSEVLQNDSA